MSSTEPPKHSFPCDYMIKIVAEAHDDFPGNIIDIIESHAVIKHHKTNKSQNNRYLSLSVTLYLEKEEILADIYQQIKTLPSIKMVL